MAGAKLGLLHHAGHALMPRRKGLNRLFLVACDHHHITGAKP